MTRDEQELESLFLKLADPFPVELVVWQVVEANGGKAFVLPFVDPRHYIDRLNAVAPGWENHIDFVLPECQLARYRLVIQGISREGIGEDLFSDPTSFEGKINRAMIRACQAFGLGRYLLFIAGSWADYDSETKSLFCRPTLPAWALPGGAGAPANAIGKLLGEPPVQQQQRQPSVPAPVKKPAIPQTTKQPDDAIADAKALTAFGSLFFKARQAGVAEGVQPVIPPITVGELRKRYAEVRDRLVQKGGEQL